MEIFGISWNMWGGVLNITALSLLVYTLLDTYVTILSVTVYLHRTVAHRALILKPFISHLFRFWLWLKTGMNSLEWGSIHRKHHAKVDTSEDPHTPIFFGLSSVWHLITWIFFLGVYKYVQEAKNKKTLEEYGTGITNDWIEKNLYTPHNFLGVGVLLGILNVTLFGLPGLVVWGVQALWIPVLAAGVINGMGHSFGYTNYKRSDPRYPNVAFSKNITFFGLVIGGEELHNNHHAFPTSPFFAHKWWEFDSGSIFVRLLCLLRLAKLKKPLTSSNTFMHYYHKVFGLS